MNLRKLAVWPSWNITGYHHGSKHQAAIVANCRNVHSDGPSGIRPGKLFFSEILLARMRCLYDALGWLCLCKICPYGLGGRKMKSTVEATGHLHSSNKILNRMRDEGTGELGPQQHETRWFNFVIWIFPCGSARIGLKGQNLMLFSIFESELVEIES